MTCMLCLLINCNFMWMINAILFTYSTCSLIICLFVCLLCVFYIFCVLCVLCIMYFIFVCLFIYFSVTQHNKSIFYFETPDVNVKKHFATAGFPYTFTAVAQKLPPLSCMWTILGKHLKPDLYLWIYAMKLYRYWLKDLPIHIRGFHVIIWVAGLLSERKRSLSVRHASRCC